MPLPRLRQHGEDFLPHLLGLAKGVRASGLRAGGLSADEAPDGATAPEASKARLWSAVLLSVIAHGAVLGLPSSHHGASAQASRPIPASLEVRLPSQTPPTISSELAAVAPPEAASPVVPEEDVPVEKGGVVSSGHYFDSAEVDVKAAPIELAPLVYPEVAFIRRLSGVVTVRVYINASGGIDAVDVVSAEPPDMFETAALDALLKTRFKPAQLFGHPVASIKLVSINFDPAQDQPAE